MLHAFLISLAVLAFLAVAFEERLHFNKAQSTLFFGTLSWMLLFIHEGAHGRIAAAFAENILDIASLWLFLFAAMTFVAYLNQHGLVEGLVYRLLPRRMPQKALLPVVAAFAYLLSSFCDNITTTLVTVALIRAIDLPMHQRIKLAVLAVFAINSGGAALITGDVTTLMIFNHGRVGIRDLFHLVPPGLISCLLLAAFLMPGFSGTLELGRARTETTPFDKAVAVIFVLTILGTLALNLFGYVPPLLVFMFGLSLVFLLSRFVNRDDEIPILEYIRRIEFDTLLFFLGVLLIVGMLKEIGTLESLTRLYGRFDAATANFLIGCMSAFVDNVPLTAAVLKASPDMPLRDWLGFTYSVGVGGSLLAIGSAAGVLMMSKIPGLSFGAYLRYTPHLGAAFVIGYLLAIGSI